MINFNDYLVLSTVQIDQLSRLTGLYSEWNDKINLISRKDMDNFETRHILHSISIALYFSFPPGSKIMDVGTGGGFPGIPLAILFPEVEFTLVDSIGKKIKVVDAIKDELGLINVIPLNSRVETIKTRFDYITGRAVTALPDLTKLLNKNLRQDKNLEPKSGIIYLKGGDYSDELKRISADSKVFELKNKLQDPFFETKKIVYLYNLKN